MTGDLVERLRSRVSNREILLVDPPRPAPDHLCHEAADCIEEQDRHLTLSGKVSKALSERIEALEAENERLRGALAEVLNDDEALMDITWVRRARAALGEDDD